MIIDKQCLVSNASDSFTMSILMHYKGLDLGFTQMEVGIVVDESTKLDGLSKFDSQFQLTFGIGEVWDLQDKIFSFWDVNGQRRKN